MTLFNGMILMAMAMVIILEVLLQITVLDFGVIQPKEIDLVAQIVMAMDGMMLSTNYHPLQANG